MEYARAHNHLLDVLDDFSQKRVKKECKKDCTRTLALPRAKIGKICKVLGGTHLQS